MKKRILLGVIAIAVMMFSMSSVSAEAYVLGNFDSNTLSSFCGGSYANVECDSNVFTLTLTSEDTLYVIDQNFVGDDSTYFLKMSSGTEIEIALDASNQVITVEIKAGTVTATVPDGAKETYFYTRKFISTGASDDNVDDDEHYPMNFIVNDGATLIFDCDVVVTNTLPNAENNNSDDTITNNGTVYYNGNVTVESGATLVGNGTNYVAATITFENGAESGLGTVLTLAESAVVYANGTISADYLVTTSGEVVYDETVNAYVVKTSEGDIENPSTGDNVGLFIGMGMVSIVGVIVTVTILKKKTN